MIYSQNLCCYQIDQQKFIYRFGLFTFWALLIKIMKKHFKYICFWFLLLILITTPLFSFFRMFYISVPPFVFSDWNSNTIHADGFRPIFGSWYARYVVHISRFQRFVWTFISAISKMHTLLNFYWNTRLLNFFYFFS